MNIAKNLIASTLQLNRKRPPLHKGTCFLVPAAAQGPQETVVSFPALVGCSPRFDPELASMLRALVLVLRPRGALPAGAQAFPVLAGPTLEGWYHVGSQLPWKQHIHLVCAVARCAAPAEEVAREIVSHLGRVGQKVESAEVVLERSEGVCEETGNSARVEITLASKAGDRPDRKAVRVRLYLQVSALDAADLPALGKLRRATIDGGNSGVYVPADRAAIVASLQEWAKTQQPQPQQKGAKGRKMAALPPTATLRMPPGWAWCEESKMFVRPRLIRSALTWPPTVASVKVVGAAIILLGLLYLALMMGLPELAARKQGKARHRAA